MGDTFPSEIMSHIQQLSQRVRELRINFDYLANIRIKFSNFAIKTEGPRNISPVDISDCCSLCDDDYITAVDDVSVLSMAVTDDIFCDVFDDTAPDLLDLKSINSNCSDRSFDYRFAAENFQKTTEEETINTPFFKLKHRDYVFNESIKAIEKYVGISQALLFIEVLDRCVSFDIHCTYFVGLNYQCVLCYICMVTWNDLLYTYHSILMSDQQKMMNNSPGTKYACGENTIEESVATCQCRLTLLNVSLEIISILIAKIFQDIEVVEQSYRWINIYCKNNDFLENYLGYSNSIVKDVKTTIVIGSSYTAFQHLKNNAERVITFHSSVHPQFVRRCTIISKGHKSMTVLKNFTTKSLSQPKRMCTDYIYRCERTVIGSSLYDDYNGYKIKRSRKLSTTLKSMLKSRLMTLSEKRWSTVLRKSYIVIYRKIISELFKFNSYRFSEIISPQKSYCDEGSYKTNDSTTEMIRMPKYDDDSLVNNTSEILPPKVEELIKLSYVDIIEHRLSDFDLQDPSVQQCSNIFDMKRAIKTNIFNTSKGLHNVPTNPMDIDSLSDDKSTNLNKFIPPMRAGIYDGCLSDSKTVVLSPRGSRSVIGTSVEILGKDCVPIKDLHEGNVLKSRQRGSKTVGNGLALTDMFKEKYNQLEAYQCGMWESTTRHGQEGSCISSNSFSFTDAQINAKYLTHLENMNRYLKTSKYKSNQLLLEDVISGDVSFKTRGAREKAVAYILNATSQARLNDQGRITKMSANIDKFIDIQNVAFSDNYRCKECSTPFKLGTELRQHLRGHTFRHKSCAI